MIVEYGQVELHYSLHSLLALEGEHYEVLYQDLFLRLAEEESNPGKTNSSINSRELP